MWSKRVMVQSLGSWLSVYTRLNLATNIGQNKRKVSDKLNLLIIANVLLIGKLMENLTSSGPFCVLLLQDLLQILDTIVDDEKVYNVLASAGKVYKRSHISNLTSKNVFFFYLLSRFVRKYCAQNREQYRFDGIPILCARPPIVDRSSLWSRPLPRRASPCLRGVRSSILTLLSTRLASLSNSLLAKCEETTTRAWKEEKFRIGKISKRNQPVWLHRWIL